MDLFSALADSETLVYDKSEAIFRGIKDVSRVLFDHSAATQSDIQTCVDWFEVSLFAKIEIRYFECVQP
jgi:hypothetical protein